MEVNLDETERPLVVLNEQGSGFPMPKIQRVAVAAIALETYDPQAISSFIGLKEKEVKNILEELFHNGWDTMGVLEEDQLYERVHMTSNDDCYPILLKKGVVACE